MSCASYFFFSLCLCASVAIHAYSQPRGTGWIWQNPIPQGNQLNAVHFAKDKLNGVAVGADSTIIKTGDGGFTWQRYTSPIDSTLTDVFVKDRKRVVIVGTRGTVLTLTDQSWQEISVPTREHLYGVTFAGEEAMTGWAVGTHGTVLKTIDGGLTWKLQRSGANEHLARVAAFDTDNVAAAASDGSLLLTRDGGGTWKS